VKHVARSGSAARSLGSGRAGGRAAQARHGHGERAAESERAERPSRDARLEIVRALRRLLNDYVQPPKLARRMQLGLERFAAIRADLAQLCARDPHELLRALEMHSILDSAEIAAHASLYRTESRWGLYHHRLDHPQRDDARWLCHVQIARGRDGALRCW
jgi:succinate dehydrogenase/fumarate reductase flavoprotein subunit